MAKSKQASTTGQIGRFGLVGILNTLIDYTIFILLTKLFSIPLGSVWTAKFVSGAIAMANSFYFNRKYVFKANSKNFRRQITRFLVSTTIAVFIIQLGLVQLFSSVVPHFGILGYNILDALGMVNLMPQVLTQALVIKTVAFGIATIASLTWNFLSYKYWAFNGE